MASPDLATQTTNVAAKARNVEAAAYPTVRDPIRPVSPLLSGTSVANAPWYLPGAERLRGGHWYVGESRDVYQDWANFPSFQPELVAPILDRGAQAMLTWEPWNHTGSPEQHEYRLFRIVDGKHDAHIRRWATGVARFNCVPARDERNVVLLGRTDQRKLTRRVRKGVAPRQSHF